MGNEKETLLAFQSAVGIVRKLIDEGGIYIVVSPVERTDIKLQVDRQFLEATLEPTPFSYGDFTKFLNEMSVMVSVCLEEREEIYVQRRVENWRDENNYDEPRIAEEKSLLERKLQVIKGTLIDDRLSQRYFLKDHAKAPYFVDFDWEVNVKHSDSEVDMAQPLPYATCRLRYARPGARPRFPWAQSVESIQIDWTEEEIDYIVRILGVVKERIRAVKQGGR